MERVSKGEGMNNYWNHEHEFFGTKKSQKKSGIFDPEVRPPPSSRFFEKIPDVIFLRPLNKNFELQENFDFEGGYP